MVISPPVPAFSFSSVEFERLFPFFVLIDPADTIVDAGRSLRSLSPTVRSGTRFSEVFSPKRPDTPLTFERMKAGCGQLRTLLERDRGTLFRGQFQPAGENLVFVGSPWITELTEFESLGLTLTDFAPHDPTLELLQLIQIQKAVSLDLQNLTRRLASQTAELEAAARSKDAFLASVSHELRTPLTGILGLSETLLEGNAGPVNEQQTRYLDVIKTSGGRLLSLVNDILDVVKIASGRAPLTRQAASLVELCTASLEAVHPLVAKRRQRMTFEDQTGGVSVEVDSRRFKQALDHLLDNASKFTPEEGRLGLRTFLRDGAAVFEVWDHGVGIAAADLDRLFQPFVQLDLRLSRRYKGVGLGLALSKQLVELHGGRIEVSSEPEQGSRFTIILPRFLPTRR